MANKAVKEQVFLLHPIDKALPHFLLMSLANLRQQATFGYHNSIRHISGENYA